MAIQQDILRKLFVTDLTNAHAVGKQALSIMTPQVERIVNYPEVADRLRLPIDETSDQIARLDEILAGFDTSGSTLKDLGLSLSGAQRRWAITSRATRSSRSASPTMPSNISRSRRTSRF